MKLKSLTRKRSCRTGGRGLARSAVFVASLRARPGFVTGLGLQAAQDLGNKGHPTASLWQQGRFLAGS
eukprot:6136513-Pyramimonas_sp.AAC.1